MGRGSNRPGVEWQRGPKVQGGEEWAQGGEEQRKETVERMGSYMSG